MSLFYCLIIREDLTILCEYQQYSGNFVQALMPFIQKLEPNVKDSFDYNKEYTVHYLNERGITFLCISDSVFSKILAYGFLEELSKRFFQVFSEFDIKNCAQFVLNNAFYNNLHTLIHKFNGNLSKETKTELKRIYNKIDEHNTSLEKLINGEEFVELTVFKPIKESIFSKEILEEHSKTKYKKCLKKCLQIIFLLVIFGVLGYLTMTTICQGYLIPECLGHYE